MVKKAPFTLWGIQALKKEMCENGGVSAEQAAKMEKPELVKALMELSETPAAAPPEPEVTPEPEPEMAPDGSGQVVEEEVTEVVELEGTQEDGEGVEELVEIGEDDDGGEEYIEIEGELEEDDGYADLADKIMEPSSDGAESPPEPVKLGEAKLDELLTKAGLLDEDVSQMTVGDKKVFLAATTETRNKMKGDIQMSQAKTKTAAKTKTPVKAKATPAKAAKAAKTTAKAATPAKTTAKKGLSINDKLKKKGLWKPGTQFISNARKEDLLAADTSRKQNKIFKEIEAKAIEIKAKQSKVAKANMKKAAKKA